MLTRNIYTGNLYLNYKITYFHQAGYLKNFIMLLMHQERRSVSLVLIEWQPQKVLHGFICSLFKFAF
jgi:hypothetical protein